MKLEITQEEREFLLRIVERGMKFIELGIKNPNLIGDFTNDIKKVEILRDKLMKIGK